MMRYLKLSTLFALALALALALTLGAVPQPAEAGLCTQLGKANGCVNNKDVANNKLKANDMKDEAGVAFAAAFDAVELTATSKIIRTVTLTAPRPGVVVVNASGYYIFDAGGQMAFCSITTGTVTVTTAVIPAENDNLISLMPFAGVRAFVVPAGSFTVNLVCREEVGTSTRVARASVVALYVPTQY